VADATGSAPPACGSREEWCDHLVVASSGRSQPLPFAGNITFTDDEGVTLTSVARLDTLMTVIDV